MSRTEKGSKGGGWELHRKPKRGYWPDRPWWQRYTHRVERQQAKGDIRQGDT